MSKTPYSSDLSSLLVIGDRVLINTHKHNGRSKGGLYLPPGVQEKEQVQQGYVLKVGPGVPMPMLSEEDNYWKNEDEKVKYIPLQVKEGDLAIFLLSYSTEVFYAKHKYYIVQHNGILMVSREND